MVKWVAVVLVGTVTCAAAFAQSLDDRVRELERRVEQLEKQVAQPASSVSAPKPASRQPDGWRHRENWRSLTRGMTEGDVRSILGEPQQVNVYPSFSRWVYPAGGDATFDAGRGLQGWTEPR
ncbi:hypothetical protein GCM10027034_30230 [Ramlibacter solisilvae]